MKLLQRYILSELIRVFALLVIVLTVLLVLVGLVREASDQGLGAKQILQILPYVVPSMLPFTIPATLLLAVTVVYGRLAGDLEVTAAKAAGVNPIVLLTPAFVLGLVLAFGSFGLTNYAIPWAMGNIEMIVTQAMEEIFQDMLRAQHHISEPEKGYSITVEDVTEKGILINPTFSYRNRDHEQVTVRASYARISFDLENKKVLIELRDARGSVPGRDSGMSLDRQVISFDMDQDIRARKPRHMTVDAIHERIEEFDSNRAVSELQRDQEAAMAMLTGDFQRLASSQMLEYAGYQRLADYRQRRLKTEIHSRYAMAGSCLFFTILGGPFAVLQARRQFITSFIMCFLPILLVYYPVMFLMVNLGKSGSVNPVWAMWVPNAILAAASVVVLRRIVQH
ncbi:MAG: LptF/LptG family permease [Fuerstiella sp.]